MKEYFKQIDALRCYAVFQVIFSHLSIYSLSESNYFHVIFKYIQGVPLFFCISGFLITTIISTNVEIEKSTLLKNFYIRRFLRIFPVYYATIFILFAFNPDNYRSWFQYDLLYISNIKIGLMGSFNAAKVAPHFWSLAVEEQFYLFWPISFFNLRTFGCLSYLGSGALLSIIWLKWKDLLIANQKYINITILLFLGFIFLISFKLIQIGTIIDFFVRTVIIPIIVLKFSIGFKSQIFKSIFENRFIIYLGKISYGLYIFHVLAIYPAVAFRKIFDMVILDNAIIMMCFKIILTITISSISWEFFEKKINKKKIKFEYSS